MALLRVGVLQKIRVFKRGLRANQRGLGAGYSGLKGQGARPKRPTKGARVIVS